MLCFDLPHSYRTLVAVALQPAGRQYPGFEEADFSEIRRLGMVVWVERVWGEAVDRMPAVGAFPDAVPGCSFFCKYRRIGECIDYKWTPPP